MSNNYYDMYQKCHVLFHEDDKEFKRNEVE